MVCLVRGREADQELIGEVCERLKLGGIPYDVSILGAGACSPSGLYVPLYGLIDLEQLREPRIILAIRKFQREMVKAMIMEATQGLATGAAEVAAGG